MKRKIIFAAILITTVLLHAQRDAQQYNPESDFNFRIEGNTVTITEYTGTSPIVNIPPQIRGLPVTHIGENAFAGIIFCADTGEIAYVRYNRLTSVTIPSSVTTIGERAFSGNLLTSVIIPNSVANISAWAFVNNRLTSVTIPGSVTNISAWAFATNRLTSVTIPGSVTFIGEGAFTNNQLTSITIPSSVTGIGPRAFSENQLTSITIGRNVFLEIDSFDSGFSRVYIRSGRIDGTYVFSNGSWR